MSSSKSAKVVLPVLWVLKTASWKLSVIFSKLEYRILKVIDDTDVHYADKRWGRYYD